MSTSLPLIDNHITYVYKAINGPLLFSAQVTGHGWDLHTGAASIKLVQAGRALAVCCQKGSVGQTHMALPVTSCSLMIQTEE